MGITILLPLAVFVLLFMLLMGFGDAPTSPPTPWQGKFLIAVALWGACLVLLTEGLGLLHSLARWPLAAGWLISLTIILVLSLRSGQLRQGYQAATSGLRSLNRLELGLLVVIASISLLLFAVAVVSYGSARQKLEFGLTYSFLLVLAFILVSLIGFSGHIFGIRYQLAFFVLGAPFVGLVFSKWSSIGQIMAVLLLIYSLPYILLSNMRPVIGHRPVADARAERIHGREG